MADGPSNEYMCEAWDGEWLGIEGHTWGSRDEAVNTALEWEADGWTSRIASRRAHG